MPGCQKRYSLIQRPMLFNFKIVSFQTVIVELIVWKYKIRKCQDWVTNHQSAGRFHCAWNQPILICSIFIRIPLKTAIKPPTPERKGTSLPQGRSRQKMVADIMNSTKLSRSHSVPASSRPPFTSFSTTPSTPGAVKKGFSISDYSPLQPLTQ